MRWLERSQARDQAGAILRDAQAMLDGTARTTTYAVEARVPAWVYLNVLAHADHAALVQLAHGGWNLNRSNWDHACAILADEVLCRTTKTRTLADVQRTLIRLELDLLGRTDLFNLTPVALVAWVSDELATSGFSRPAS
jgi:hypothetical protein